MRRRNKELDGSTSFRLMMGNASLEVTQNFFYCQLISPKGYFVKFELSVGLVEFADSDVRLVDVVDFECPQFQMDKASSCGADA